MGVGDAKSLTTKSWLGRPTVMTEEILGKLREAFLIGASDNEACAYAEISRATLYNYQKDNPDFLDVKEQWKDTPILAARNKVVAEIKSDTVTARWYLERKRRKEFGPDKGEDDTNVRNQLNIFMGNHELYAERLTRLLGGFNQGSGDGQTAVDDTATTAGRGIGADPGGSEES